MNKYIKEEIKKHCDKYLEIRDIKLKFLLVNNGTLKEEYEDFDIVDYDDIICKKYQDGTAEIDLRWFNEDYKTILQITANEDYGNTLILNIDDRVAYDWGYMFCAEIKKEYGENIGFASNNIDFIG